MSGSAERYHIPVMPAEVLAGLGIRPEGRYLDATAGGGGHSSRILDKLNRGGRLTLLDRDDEALAELRQRFAGDERVVIRKLNFAVMGTDEAVKSQAPYDGILFDLGVSSRQIDDPARGFSFMKPGPLDMRMDRAQGLTAARVVNEYGPSELTRILREYGEEPRAKRIVEEIIRARPFSGTQELVEAVERLIGVKDRIQSLARVFQGIRIEVNGELSAIEVALRAACELLSIGGRLAVLSYHSLEDRRTKRFLREMEGERAERYLALPGEAAPVIRMRAVPRRAVTASAAEIATNPRSRSARLRVAEKVG